MTTWERTATLTGTGQNVPSGEVETPGTLWLYAPKNAAYNNTHDVTLGALGVPLPAGAVIDRIVINGTNISLTEVGGDGDQPIGDMTAELTLSTEPGTPLDWRPFEGVEEAGYTEDQSAVVTYSQNWYGDPQSPDGDDGTWTGWCSSDGTGSGCNGGTIGPYSGGVYPDLSALTSNAVTDDTVLSIRFWDVELNGFGAASEDPQSRSENVTVTIYGSTLDEGTVWGDCQGDVGTEWGECAADVGTEWEGCSD